jgi:protoporphyrin/coproporphyrin ferrochelatase
MADSIGLLVMAYGGPGSLDEVEPYLRDVRGFRDTPPEVVDEVRARYAAIGGRSPILERTGAQARALEEALNTNRRRFTAVVGMRHWHPYIGDALVGLAEAGVERAVGLVMAPHYSRMSIERYFKEAEEAQTPVKLAPIREWHLLPGYVAALEDRVRAALARFPAEMRDSVPLILSAHSLPERILQWNDPYPVQLAATTRAVVERLGGRSHRFAYQSAAMTPEPWLGPDAGDVIAELAREGHRHVLVVPIGFTCDHVEVLYDVDVALQRRARDLGVHLERIEMVNDHPVMIGDLASLVRATAAAEGWV